MPIYTALVNAGQDATAVDNKEHTVEVLFGRRNISKLVFKFPFNKRMYCPANIGRLFLIFSIQYYMDHGDEIHLPEPEKKEVGTLLTLFYGTKG